MCGTNAVKGTNAIDDAHLRGASSQAEMETQSHLLKDAEWQLRQAEKLDTEVSSACCWLLLMALGAGTDVGAGASTGAVVVPVLVVLVVTSQSASKCGCWCATWFKSIVVNFRLWWCASLGSDDGAAHGRAQAPTARRQG